MSRKDVTDEMVCAAYAEAADQRGPHWRFDYEYPYEILQRKTGECFKVCYAAMERADSRGLIDYGVSLRTGWLTDKGLALLAENAQPAIRHPQVLDCSDGTQEYPRF